MGTPVPVGLIARVRFDTLVQVADRQPASEWRATEGKVVLRVHAGPPASVSIELVGCAVPEYVPIERVTQWTPMPVAPAVERREKPEPVASLACDVCGQLFEKANALGAHKRYAHGIKGTSHKEEP